MSTSSTHPDGQDEARDGQDGLVEALQDEAQDGESYKHWAAYFTKLRRSGPRSFGITFSHPIDVGAKWGPRWVRGGSKTKQERRPHHLLSFVSIFGSNVIHFQFFGWVAQGDAPLCDRGCGTAHCLLHSTRSKSNTCSKLGRCVDAALACGSLDIDTLHYCWPSG